METATADASGELVMLFGDVLAKVFCHFDTQANDCSTETASFGICDDKLDEAIQMVKGGLMCAVNREVDNLKQKLNDLETKIDQLKFENGLLRQYAPAEIIRQINESASPKAKSPIDPSIISNLEFCEGKSAFSETSTLTPNAVQ